MWDNFKVKSFPARLLLTAGLGIALLLSGVAFAGSTEDCDHPHCSETPAGSCPCPACILISELPPSVGRDLPAPVAGISWHEATVQPRLPLCEIFRPPIV